MLTWACPHCDIENIGDSDDDDVTCDYCGRTFAREAGPQPQAAGPVAAQQTSRRPQ